MKKDIRRIPENELNRKDETFLIISLKRGFNTPNNSSR